MEKGSIDERNNRWNNVQVDRVFECNSQKSETEKQCDLNCSRSFFVRSSKDPGMDGSILYFSNLKMHRSRPSGTCRDFSEKLVEAAEVKRGQTLLDLFFGLGYCTYHALNIGASKVVAFEVRTYWNTIMQATFLSIYLSFPYIQHFTEIQRSWRLGSCQSLES
jgi:hypothetical protein